MADIHITCIEIDKTIGNFLPPLDHDRITKWYESQAPEVEYGACVSVLVDIYLSPKLVDQYLTGFSIKIYGISNPDTHATSRKQPSVLFTLFSDFDISFLT